MKNSPYRVIEILLITLIYAIGYIPLDVRLQFLIANQKAVKLLEDLAGIRISEEKTENPNQMRLF